MAEPTDRLAINDGVGGRKKVVGMKKMAEMKGKKREEKTYLYFLRGQNYSDQPGEADTMKWSW